ncbi:MAG: dipeptidyl-peptidase 3 family protein [Nannocystaceae bacterium]|nr:hypothetical protein [bacterium]
MVKRSVSLAALLVLCACNVGGSVSASTKPPAAAPPAAEDEGEGEAPERTSPAASMQAKVDQFAVAELTADISSLPQSERDALEALIEASKHLDPIFDRQAWAGNPDLEQQLADATDDEGKARYAYFRMMRGPWDRQNDHEPFAIDKPHPKGAGFYPEGMTAEDFEAWLTAHPGDREAFEGLFTVIEREGESYVAVPYSKAYAKWLEPAAKDLERAATLTKNKSLKRFLKLRAKGFRTDDYYASDKAWMDLDSRVEITIGPYETYEDKLMNYKASFESFVTVSDPKASKALAKYKKYLPKMEQNLPVDDSVKTKRGAQSPIRVVDLVFTSGDARTSVQTIAFNLPNDERVRKEKGAKKVLLRNLIETKFDAIMKPIGERVLAPKHHASLSGDAFFHQVLFHELSHSLGPAFTQKDGRKVEVRVAIGPAYSAIEECKADVMGAYNILYMIDQGELPADFREKLLVSYFGGLFRSVRFGVAEAHGRGAAVQINRFLEEGSVTVGPKGRFQIGFAKLEQSISDLVRDLVMLQHNGDRAAVEAFLDQYGVLSDPMANALGRLDGIPVDIRPVYPLAGETGPR